MVTSDNNEVEDNSGHVEVKEGDGVGNDDRTLFFGSIWLFKYHFKTND